MRSIEGISVYPGAMGTLYASKFFDIDENCISLIAEGERYARLKERGFFINSRHYLLPLFSPDDKAAPSDLIMVAVKHDHLPKAILDVRNRVVEKSTIKNFVLGEDLYASGCGGQKKDRG